MLHGSAVSLLSRLAQHAPLQRALPLLAAFVPEAFRGLHVFARRPNCDHSKVEVRDGADAEELMKAVTVQLKLGARPGLLLREVEGGGAPVPLDCRRALAEQGVHEGTSVLVEMPAPTYEGTSVLVEMPAPMHEGTSVRTEGVLPPPPYVLAWLSGSLRPIRVALLPGADANDLRAAVLAALFPGARPHSARLLLKSKGGALVPLTGLERLSKQGVVGGSSIVVQVTPLPPPLEFVEEVLGGERTVVANLQGTPGFEAPYPFFLSPTQLSVLEHFLQGGPPCDMPSLLMVTGTPMSGKSRILTAIIPRLLSLYYARAPAAAGHRCPIIFYHCFDPGAPAGEAAEQLVARLQHFASEQGIDLPEPIGTAFDHLPRTAQALAEGIHQAGSTLWLLFDELGAPIVASPEREAARFVQLFKDLLTATHTCARTVATGGAMVALLKAIADARVNDYSLWSAAVHLHVGQEPAPALALAMAQRLRSVYAPSWQPAVQALVSPQTLVDCLAYGAHGGLTSPRPALLAHFAGSLRNSVSISTGEEMLHWVLQGQVLGRLEAESRRDTATALGRMTPAELKELRLLAERGVLPRAPLLATFAAALCQEPEVAREQVVRAQQLHYLDHTPSWGAGPPPAAMRLLPPFGRLLQRWVTQDGWLAICSREPWQPLAPRVMHTLERVRAGWRGFDQGLSASLTEAVLQTLADVGIGVPVCPPTAAVRPPRTVAELLAIPAIAHLVTELAQGSSRALGKRPSHAAMLLRSAAGAGEEAQAQFMAHAGRHVLLLLRSYLARVYRGGTAQAQGVGLTEAAMDWVVRAAAAEIVSAKGGSLYIDEHGALMPR
jgi:hypothetical protein